METKIQRVLRMKIWAVKVKLLLIYLIYSSVGFEGFKPILSTENPLFFKSIYLLCKVIAFDDRNGNS